MSTAILLFMLLFGSAPNNTTGQQSGTTVQTMDDSGSGGSGSGSGGSGGQPGCIIQQGCGGIQ